MRVLVTGSREWPWAELVWSELGDIYATEREPLTIVHGACPKGADFHAALWCKMAEKRNLFVTEEPHPATWTVDGVYNKAAGFHRNKHMVDLGADLCLAYIFRDSKGATMTANLAEKAGIETRRHER